MRNFLLNFLQKTSIIRHNFAINLFMLILEPFKLD